MTANNSHLRIAVAYYMDIVGVVIARYSGRVCNLSGLASLAAHRRGKKVFPGRRNYLMAEC